MSRYRLGILTTHPIQYQAPWFRRLAAHPELDLTVLFCMIPTAAEQGTDFGVEFQWDAPLREGYRHEVLANTARRPSSGSFFGCDTPSIADRIAAKRFDALLIHGWSVKSHFQALAACLRHRVPALVRGDSNLMAPQPWWKRLRRRWLLARFSACLPVGRSNRDLYRESGVPEERLFDVLHFVDNEHFARQNDRLHRDRPVLRRAWGIEEDAVVPLYCGKFIAKKRPMDFLKAVDRVDRETGGVHALLVGDGPLRESCERWARERHLPAAFAGFLNQGEIPQAYAAADVLVLPSDWGETWGLVVNEAMASGLPAVVSDQVGCGPDLVACGQTGEVYPCGNVAALASRLGALANNPARLQRMGQAARRQVARYSVDAAVEGTVAAVRFVCKKESR